MPIDGAARYAGGGGDLFQAGSPHATLEKNPAGGLDDVTAGDFGLFLRLTNHLAFPGSENNGWGIYIHL